MKRLEAEHKLKTLDAIDRFPKAMKVCQRSESSGKQVVVCFSSFSKPPLPLFVFVSRQNAVSLLNAVLLESAPSDAPAPRRSKRSAADEDQNDPPTPKKKSTASALNKRKPEAPIDDDDLTLSIAEPILDDSPAEDEGVSAEKSDTVAQRKRVARNVGGWISPEFSKEIDRSWLERNAPDENFDLSTYVPQVGDTVL